MTFYLGLDLGQAADYTALAIIQDVMETIEEGEDAGKQRKVLHLRHLERYPHHTPYTEITDNVAALLADPRLSPDVRDGFRLRKSRPSLCVDYTGVGRPVADLLRSKGLRFTPVTITGGETVTRSNGSWRVPKRDLVAALEVPFHTGILKVAEGLDLWPVLKNELLNFRRKISMRTGHDSYEHWRESDHDDLVLASALACWERIRPKGRPMRVIR